MNPFELLNRWRMTRIDLVKRIDALEQENGDLRAKVAELQHAKQEAERSASERRREKEVLRSRLSSEKKKVESAELVAEQMGAKLAELRDENERLNRSGKLDSGR